MKSVPPVLAPPFKIIPIEEPLAFLALMTVIEQHDGNSEDHFALQPAQNRVERRMEIDPLPE